MIEFPKHGELSFGPNTKQRKVFSLAQLRSNKVVYLHNGKENLGDSFVFEIEIDSSDTPVSSQAALGSLMTVRQRHLFEIRILPVNDKPVVRGTLGSILMMAAGTRMTLPPQFLQVKIMNIIYFNAPTFPVWVSPHHIIKMIFFQSYKVFVPVWRSYNFPLLIDQKGWRIGIISLFFHLFGKNLN